MPDFVSPQCLLRDPVLHPLMLAPLIDCFRILCTFNFEASAGERAKEGGPSGATHAVEGRAGPQVVEQGT